MAIRKPSGRTPAAGDGITEAAIERVINGGSPPPAAEAQPVEAEEVRFQMVVPAALCRAIDQARGLTRTSRRAWLLQAAQEKLEREGKL
jgi:hypothetical protein